jgi:hypothetical protein
MDYGRYADRLILVVVDRNLVTLRLKAMESEYTL